jgi:hypothetical protein
MKVGDRVRYARADRNEQRKHYKHRGTVTRAEPGEATVEVVWDGGVLRSVMNPDALLVVSSGRE